MRLANTLIAGALASAMLLTAGTAEARQGVIKVRGSQGVATAARGPNGGEAFRGRGVRQNPDGSVTRASGGAYRTPYGGTSRRKSQSTVGPDGSVSRSGSYQANGYRGNVASSGSVYRDPYGNWSGGRSTSATNAATGNSYYGSTTIDPATGKPVHSGTCTNAYGEAIACPR